MDLENVAISIRDEHFAYIARIVNELIDHLSGAVSWYVHRPEAHGLLSGERIVKDAFIVNDAHGTIQCVIMPAGTENGTHALDIEVTATIKPDGSIDLTILDLLIPKEERAQVYDRIERKLHAKRAVCSR